MPFITGFLAHTYLFIGVRILQSSFYLNLQEHMWDLYKKRSFSGLTRMMIWVFLALWMF